MALSTRAKLAGLGGALALGVLGATGVAYAAGDGTGTPRYVTTVDDGTAAYGQQAPGDSGRPAGKDCPEGAGRGPGEPDGGSGGNGGNGGSPAPATPATPSGSAPANPADA